MAGDLGRGLTIEHGPTTANTWAQCRLVLITTDIYWNSAVQKIRSTQFRTGRYLAQWMHTYTQVKHYLPYRRRDAVPGIVRRHLGNLIDRDIQVWLLVSVTVIAREIMLPLPCSSRRPCLMPSPPASPCTPPSHASNPANSSPSPALPSALTAPSRHEDGDVVACCLHAPRVGHGPSHRILRCR
ncbi:hypothetical protein [Streptomyces lydicus]|uniref:hypothetical protein n=1 Tax=Streptomyces lydicus TaxID=47763 RepID=UPI0036F12974